MSIKVVHSLQEWLPLTQTWLYNCITHLEPEVENTVVCEKTAHTELFPFYRVRSVTAAGNPGAWSRLKRRLRLQFHEPLLEKTVRETKPALLHSHFGMQGWANHRLARRRRLPHVISFYGFDVSIGQRREKWQQRYRQMFASADRVFCEGPFMAKTIENLGCPAEKLQVQRLGVNLDKIPFKERNFQAPVLRFFIAATFTEKKGIPYALEALGLLAREGVEFEVTVVGDANRRETEQAEKAKIQEVVRRHALGGRVKFAGFVPHPQMLAMAREHHIFLSPSVTAANGDCEGGAPVGLIEMAAGGMPVISTTHCDIPFVLGEGNRAILAPERDPVALKEVIAALVRDRGRMPLLAAENRRFIEENLDVRVCARELGLKYAALQKSEPEEAE